jgi:hypothetical protein
MIIGANLDRAREYSDLLSENFAAARHDELVYTFWLERSSSLPVLVWG